MTRNSNPTRIKDNNESPITTRNPSIIRIQDVIRNPNPTWIHDVIRNPYPTWIEEPLTYNGSPITWAYAKKMNEVLRKLIPKIWA